MTHLDRPQTLAIMKELALRLDARLNARWEEKQSARTASNPSQSRPAWNTRTPNQQSSNQATQGQPPHSSRTSSFPPASANASTNPTPTTIITPAIPKQNFPTHTPDDTVPMELGSHGWQLTNTEKQRRRSNNLYLYYTDPGHRAYQCLPCIHRSYCLQYELRPRVIRSYAPPRKIKMTCNSTSKTTCNSNGFKLKLTGLYRVRDNRSFHTTGEYPDLHSPSFLLQS
jgi:hypothetical protein